MTVISRQALFEAAWTRPLSELAAEWGISDVGLRKICDRHDIPTPGRGYWTQVRAGKVYPRPTLRPARDPRQDEVRIAGGRPLPPAVVAAMQAARAQPTAAPGVRRRRRPRAAAAGGATEESAPETSRSDRPAPAELETASGPAAPAPATPGPVAPRRELAATRKALARAKPDAEGFLCVLGAGVASMRLGPASVELALDFLEALLVEADRRGWRWSAADGPVQLDVDGERLAVRISEAPAKTAHVPTQKELAEKARRDRWGGDSQPWRTWDLNPSGRLAFVIDENAWSGLRRTFSQRKGYAFLDALESVVAGLAGHAAAKAERRRAEDARAKAAAIAEAQRQRLEAFQRRETQRDAFAAAVADLLSQRARLTAVLTHLEAQAEDQRQPLAEMETWLRRKLKGLDARLDPGSLEVSARYAKVAFAEPPSTAQSEYWSPRDIELYIWRPDPQEDLMRTVAELDWAISEGLIADPRAEPPPSPAADAAGAEAGGGETNPPAETSH